MDWTQILIGLLGIVFTGVLIPMLHAAFGWLKSKTRNEAMITALGEAQTVADNVVASLQATLVDVIKAKNANGKLTPEQAKEVAQSAVKMFLADMSARSLAFLDDCADDLAAYAGRLLEARLLRLKGVD